MNISEPRVTQQPPPMETAAAACPAFWKRCAVLVVDPDAETRALLDRTLACHCGLVATAASADAGDERLTRQHFDLIVADIALPGKNALNWLQELRAQSFFGEVVLLTAFGDMETAVSALRAGASDLILKPFQPDQILSAIGRALDRIRLKRENFILKREVAELGTLDGIIGGSPAMRHLCTMVKRIAPMPSTVLIHGESGTGKEVVARALHARSTRAHCPFVPVNCSAMSEELIESELFGHVKGAFTGAYQAHDGLFFYGQGGTLFLDEIGELPLPIQAKLLRVLEERKVRPVGSERELPVDVRIIAATNRDLAEEVRAGRFRRDLFYRLDVVTLSLPPLRERIEDIPLLGRYFIKQLAAQLGVEPLPLTHHDVQRLAAYAWPGNVRELRNVLERSLILGHFTFAWGHEAAPPPIERSADHALELPLAEVEKRHILQVLAAAGGNKSEAARRLQVSRRTLERKCVEWGYPAS